MLPGSNLTNLIVLGHLHLTGGQFAARMWLPWLAAVAVTDRTSLLGLVAVPLAMAAAIGALMLTGGA